ncbi:hypothetical protein JCM17845_11980 [Iodidimonas gelatinilytica]|uniref:Bifunctional diguanylate cyclase/phosphodiesterase n=1 Tax=Iodidimonas gelatinilytica TaxID=1236966 RepID=A0A5A7MYP6_9PROT|nr:GGDEF domain-containing phosphodiesterase [Iodidimonas gelatinilytica]GER00575.1 hypothetical protein JCM17845_11980 [Iodidimonas gelatinilytica]
MRMADTERPLSQIDCLLITGRDVDQWMGLLASSQVDVQHVSMAAASRMVDRQAPQVVFIDIETFTAHRSACSQLLFKWGHPRPLVIALILSQNHQVSPEFLKVACDPLVDDIILSESNPKLLSARVFYLLMRHHDRMVAPLHLEWAAADVMPVEQAVEQKNDLEKNLLGSSVLGQRAFRNRIRAAVEMAEADHPLCLVIINVDRFKRVLSQYGRDNGDLVLRASLNRIRAAAAALTHYVKARAGEQEARRLHHMPLVGQLSGEEFAILLPGLRGKANITQAVQSLLQRVSAPLRVDGRSVYLSASAGIAVAPTDALTADDLLKAAHSAVTSAKQRPGNSVAFYSQHLAASEAQKMEVEGRLRDAMALGELEMYFQPQASVRSGDVVGVEALVRWNHPDLGLVSPESFIPIAEEAGITVDLGCWVIESALAGLGRLEAAGLPALQLSINVSADMFTDYVGSRLVQVVRDSLKKSGIPPRRLTLEITERTIIDESGNAPQVIDDLKALGVRLALDDFGTGYSSLGYLKALPIDELKIDRTFIMGQDKEDRAFLRAIISMAKTLNMVVVAEGVETQEQLVRLYEEGCDMYQGYLCSPPVSESALPALVKTTFPATSPAKSG